MKKVLVLAAAVALFATPVFAGSGTILNSDHDLSGASNQTDELCVFCHTPHGGGTVAPLWNRGTYNLSSANVYTSATLNASIDMTVGDAKLCMTCHDGDVTDSLTNLGGTASGALTGNLTFGGVANLGTDFRNDHPVGFTYNTALATADGELNDPATDADVAGLLFSGVMWCSSCHDVHKPGLTANNDVPFLRTSNASSALCLTCHNK